jgi:hypothetical protein
MKDEMFMQLEMKRGMRLEKSVVILQVSPHTLSALLIHRGSAPY